MFAASKTAKAASAAAATDPQFNYVTMLLHGNGTNGAQNNTFLDSSTNNFTVTRNGNTTQGTWSPYGSNWSNYFDGTGDDLRIATNAAFAIGTGDFTFEAWINPPSWPSGAPFFVCTGTGGLWIGKNGSNFVVRAYGVADQLQYATLPTTNVWTHIVAVRSGTTLSLFYNGTRVATTTNVFSFTQQPVAIGSDGEPTSPTYYTGYISNLRLVKGTAVYDPTASTLTVPTAPLTAITNTSLLTCQSNRFIDNSTNNFSITKNGDTSVQRFSPFSPTAAYSTSVIGGSGYFDGTGDYLTAPNNTAFDLSTSDFTLEGFFYPTVGSASQSIFAYASNAGASISDYAYQLLINSSNGINFRVVASGSSSFTTISTSNTISLNAWNYVCVTRTGTSVSVYLNGTTTTGTIASTIRNNTGSILTVGRDPDGTFAITGYLSNLRILKGTAVTPSIPTAPLTAITNTSLLLSYTNAGIFDNAMMNDLETVGNAQISTSVKKYGTGSIYLDGAGDYLPVLNSVNYIFGTGDFTVECWIYPLTVSGSELPVFKLYGSVNSLIELRQVNNTMSMIFRATNGTTSTLTSSAGTISANTWQHIAFCRSSGTLGAYINGTQYTTASNANTQTDTSLTINIGANQIPNAYFNGYIDDFRITKGYARYTSSFTPPTAAFPNN